MQKARRSAGFSCAVGGTTLAPFSAAVDYHGRASDHVNNLIAHYTIESCFLQFRQFYIHRMDNSIYLTIEFTF